jgi:uncharacterized protein with GYD domain
VKYIALLKHTAKGREELPRSAAHFGELQEIIKGVGGTLLEAFATSGRYDYVAIVDYPTPEAGFAARVKIAEMGVLEEEPLEAFDMRLLMASV